MRDRSKSRNIMSMQIGKRTRNIQIETDGLQERERWI